MRQLPKGSLNLSPARKSLLDAMLRKEGMGPVARDQIPGREPASDASKAQTFPLSFAQERLWFLDQLLPRSTLYNVSVDWRFTYPVDIVTLRRSVNEVVRRHEILRTTFSSIDGEPIQIVAPSLTLSVPIVDLSKLPAGDRDAAALGVATNEARTPFDLVKGPLLRLILLNMGADDYILILTIHHIIADGWSLGLFWDELLAIWTAYDNGDPSPLADLPIQYADFAVWQRKWLVGEILGRQIGYWTRQLDGLSVLRLRTDRPRSEVPTANGDTQPILLPAGLSEALGVLSREERVTLFMTLLAAFQTLLFRYSSQDDIAVGTFIANRTRAEVESLIGFFVNTIVLRADFSQRPSFVELLRQVRETTLAAYGNQDLPFARLVQELQMERNLGLNPLFQVGFQLVNVPGGGQSDVAQDDSAVPALAVKRGTAILDITFTLWEGSDGLAGEVEYNRDLFDPDTIRQIIVNYRNLLVDIVRDRKQAVHRLLMTDDDERRRLLVDWNATGSEYPREASIVSLFEAQVGRAPEATALVFEGAQIGYGDLNRRANRLARHLRSLGVGLESRVGICMDRSIDMVVGLLAILKAGAAYVPLDPAYPMDRLAYVVNDAGLEILLSQERVEGRLPRSGARIVRLEQWDAVAENEGNIRYSDRAGQLAYVIYTSGSTGKPKGVLAMHRGAINRFAWMWAVYPFAPHEVCCARTSLSFVDSVWEIFGPLLGGIRTVIISEEKLKDVSQLVSTLAEQKVTRLVLVPSLLSAMLDSFDDLGTRLGELRYWITSGETIDAELAQRFQERVPHGALINLYGSSEVAGDVTWFDASKAGRLQTIPIGRPIANTQAYIVDSELRLVPVGVPGELLVGGEGLARGYHNLPELTAEKFIPNPFGKGRLYRTGDLARYLANSQIEFLGRRDRQVKVRGHRIELGEIEATLSRHPSVRQASVLVRDDAAEQQLLAYVVRNLDYDGSELCRGMNSWNEEQIRGWQEVWTGTYRDSSVAHDPTLNFVGWNSSYTGLPIPDDEMREWATRSAQTVLSLRPRRVLEIGCGTGLMLFQIAPHCDHYCGTDFSPEALRCVKAQLPAQNLRNVNLLQREAHDFSGFEPESFDAVVLNSVVQYFPNIEYLIEVLTGSINVLRSGGTIYIGDVRSLPLLEAFHTSVELHRAPPRLTVGQLRERVRNSMTGEVELLIEPAFFHALKKQLPRIEQVHIAPKRGRFQNELTRFRYQIIIKLDSSATVDKVDAWLDWRRDNLSLPKIRELLRMEGKLAVAGIPNARLTREMKALELLATLDERQFVSDLQQALDSFPDNGVDPEELCALQNEGLRTVQLSWAGTGADDCFRAFICSRCEEGEGGIEVVNPPLPIEGNAPKSLSQYSNSPVREMQSQALMSELRRFLSTALPDHMIPSAVLFLDAFPLTASGKLDYAALPVLDRSRRTSRRAYVGPRTGTERLLAGIWTQVLGLERVDVRDNFFEIGGHSLIATRLLSRVRETFKLELPLRVIFESSTIADMAEVVDTGLARGVKEEAPPTIMPLSRRTRAATILPNGTIDLAHNSQIPRGVRSSDDPELRLDNDPERPLD